MSDKIEIEYIDSVYMRIIADAGIKGGTVRVLFF